MLQITPQHRLLLAVEPVDFRKDICGLKALCQQKLSCDPFSGAIFAFTNVLVPLLNYWCMMQAVFGFVKSGLAKAN